VFCSVDWEQQFLDSFFNSGASDDSDHYPLILGLKDNHLGRRRFHFESLLPKFEGFQDAVQQA
jgi:hypothetical protein